MKPRHRILTALLLIVTFGGLIWLLASPRGREPVYQGKGLGVWLTALDGRNADDTGLSRRDAYRAIREAGTNAVPTVLRLLRATDFPLKTRLIVLANKQHFIDFHLRTAVELHREAGNTAWILRSRLGSAVPELIKMYAQEPPLDCRSDIANILRAIGPTAERVVPDQRWLAISNNAYKHPYFTNVFDSIQFDHNSYPAGIMNNLRSNNAKDQMYGVDWLIRSGSLGDNPLGESLVATLLDLLKKPGANAYWVKFALEAIDPDIAARILTNDNANADSILKETSPQSGPGIAEAADDVLAPGDWSTPAGSESAGALRGRLLVQGGINVTNRFGEWWGQPRVQVELQSFMSYWPLSPPTVYFDVRSGLECELRDSQGREVPFTPSAETAALKPAWVMVPPDGTAAFRVDSDGEPKHAKPDATVLEVGKRRWRIPFGDTNAYYLSATFNPPTNHVNPLDYRVWSGTLTLPAVRVPGR